VSFERRSLSEDAEMVLEADVNLPGFDCCIDIVDMAKSGLQVMGNQRECRPQTPSACRRESWGE
jgi:hypothetical protein